jgi:repressor LexA
MSGLDIVIYHDMSDLTPRQKQILEALAWFEGRRVPAFVPDLVARLKLAAESSLTPTLRILERKGMLAIGGGGAKGRSRVLQLTAEGRRAVGLGGLPLLGSIPAGPLSEAVSEAQEMVEIEAMLPWRPGDFLLRVKGDSMIGDGILDGDKVLLRPEVEPYAGEIAAVLVGEAHEATLKHFLPLPETNQVKLRASNPGYRDLVVPAELVKVAGVFRGLIRDGSRTGQ